MASQRDSGPDKSAPLLGKGHRANLSIAGGLLVACFMTNTWAVEDLSDLSTKERLARLEQLWENQGAADMVLRLESLQQDMQRLQGELEVQGHTIEVLQNSLRAMEQRGAAAPVTTPPVQTPSLDQPAVDADVPISAVLDGDTAPVDGIDSSGSPTAPGNTPPVDAGTIPVVPPGVSIEPSTAGSAEQLAYQQAFSALKSRQYDQAISGFNDYLSRYPQENNADNAQYWLGEAYYVKRKFSDAQQAFATLLERYPDTPKRADATLKIAFIHYELSQWGEARKVLDEVKANYPGTAAAQLAEARLQKMTKEGH
ncbi:MAG: tol-pal system protein YbgF [Gammaproteobacteria bacterium]